MPFLVSLVAAGLLGALALAFLAPSLGANILALLAGFNYTAHGRLVVFAAHTTIIAGIVSYVKIRWLKKQGLFPVATLQTPRQVMLPILVSLLQLSHRFG